jgi:NhaP-type Na+/H+ or K+/H+ antiporter
VTAYTLLGVFTLLFCLVGRRLLTTVLTAPMAFIGFGVLLAQLDLVPAEGSEKILHMVAEVALVVLLFLDAAKIDAKKFRRRHVWPRRMLLIGLPLGILIGAGVNMLLMPTWPLAVAGLMAAILAPTDAALGQPVITNSRVPERQRYALTVESGLNDGLALPAVLFFASLVAHSGSAPAGGWVVFAALQLTLGPIIGLAIGAAGGKLMLWAKRLDFTSETFEGIAALSLAALSYLVATTLGGNGFISAFIGGLGFGMVVRGKCKFVYEFTEGEGQILSWTAFFLLGALLVPEAISHLTWPMLGLIMISLLIVRPLAIYLSLIGTDAAPITRLFFGWFGPRGLATALFALLVIGDLEHNVVDTVIHVAINAVWISALLHGLSAVSGANWYVKRLGKLGDCTERKPLERAQSLTS